MHGKHITVSGCDARSILTTMLQQQQRIIDQLINGTVRDDANNATHGGLLNKNNSKLYVPRKVARQKWFDGPRRGFRVGTQQRVFPEWLLRKCGHAA
jgi:hypothetical protein